MDKVMEEGYDGIEINLPESKGFLNDLTAIIDSIRTQKTDFIFIGQQVLQQSRETVDEYIGRMTRRLHEIAALQPDFINSHTGKDYFSFDDNCRVIEAAMEVAEKTGIPILHETHRGRFSFHAAGLLPFLQKFPEIKLVADFSHWCAVSESLLQDQQVILQQIIPYVGHVHARIGFEHGPQVNDPFAPEWGLHVQTFIDWWKQILDDHQKNNQPRLTITTEFGPAPYMPALPYTRQPTADQWKINARLKDLLKKELQP
jgi:sugar phosphate isomerase/epimerase